MAVIDSKKKEINFKIVYYGPALSGKTTSIEQLQNLIKSKKKSKIKKHTTAERTLFFDFLALSSDQIGGYKTRFQVYTVPGQVLYDDARKLLLNGVDGIIFVADSQMEKIQEDLRSLEELSGHISNMGYSPQDVSMVIQYNKRDLPNSPSLHELQQVINKYHVPDFESIATKGEGVVPAFKECVRQVVSTLKNI